MSCDPKRKVIEGADSNVEIMNFGPDDVFIKGGNVVDNQGNVGIWVSNVKGGTIGMCWPIMTPRGSHLIQPVGLEKLVPSVPDAAWHSGIYHYKYSTGLPGKIVPVSSSLVLTEIQAFGILARVRAFHIASGGVGGSEGAVALSLEGGEEEIKQAFELSKSIKGEPRVTLPEKYKLTSPADYQYDAMTQIKALD